MRTAPMRREVLFHLRDADGLDIYEYSFLLTVELRGILRTSRAQTLKDMRMEKDRYYKTRDSLELRGLITIRKEKSVYRTLPVEIRVNKAAVMRLPKRADACPDADDSIAAKKRIPKRKGSTAQTSVSVTQTDMSATQTTVSAMPDRKKKQDKKRKNSKIEKKRLRSFEGP